MKQNGLPSFRHRGLSSLNVPRRYHLPLILLRTLSLLPSLLGAYHNTCSAWAVPIRDSGGALILRSTQSDFWIANFWCALAGYWSWILTTSMMRRWLYHYEISNAVVRVITLTVINWSLSAFVNAQLEADQPVAIWMSICVILLVSNILKLCFGTNAKYHRKAEDVQSPRINLKSTAVKVLVLPLSVVTFVTMFGALQQMDRLQYQTSQLMQQPFGLDTRPAVASAPVVVLILSSWSPLAAERRHMLRKTSLRLLSNDAEYRFVIGQPPSAHVQMTMGPKIELESATYHDMLLVPAADPDTHSSRKLFEALRWSRTALQYDYLLKAADTVFVRWDIVQAELAAQGPQSAYWRGLVYRNMPPDAFNVDKSINTDYPLPILPPYTSGALYTLSRDIVDLVVGIETPQRFVASEERNLGIWLFGYDIQPIHDARIQDTDACDQTQLAKRLSDARLGDMVTMYENVVNQRPQCTGLDTGVCGVCYPCYGKRNDWRALNLACDEFQGITLVEQPDYKRVSGPTVRDALAPSVLGENDAWIIEGVLSQRTSVFSDTDQWHLLYWVCWTSDASTFMERHWRALELVWVHEPDAVIMMITNTLPTDFFDEYQQYGYNIHVVHFNRENLLNWHWYFGPGTEDWLREWDRWADGKFFYWHLTDYIRCLLLYNYGGTYMDMDALWIRVPPDTDLEFIGSDYSSLASDREWTLDDEGLYLPQGLMRFKRGWRLFREMCEAAFSAYAYDAECFNCHGPKAITSYVREHRAALEMGGFTILPREVLYPASYLEINRFLLPNPLAEHELRTKIMVHSWNIHLFGKMTNHLDIEPGSIVDHVLRLFDLDVPHADSVSRAVLSSSGARIVPMRLVGPRSYIYRFMPSFTLLPADAEHKRRAALQHPAPGRFQGLDRIYVRGGPAAVDHVTVSAEVAFGTLTLLGNSTEQQQQQQPFTSTAVTLHNATQRQVNVLLNSLLYSPSKLLEANGGRDRMSISVKYSTGEHAELLVDVIVVEAEDDE